MVNLRGRVKFPIGGIVRERSDTQDLTWVQVRIWCNSKTDSIVWMEEDNNSTNQCNLFCYLTYVKNKGGLFLLCLCFWIYVFFSWILALNGRYFVLLGLFFCRKEVEVLEKQDFMMHAIALAKKGIGMVDPNPLVGAVLVKNGQIIGEGYHAYFGGPHAERNAIANCQTSLEGATLFVTLEPCCHTGKTPPCTEAILEAGIRHVVIGSKDPNPLVAGKGIAQLQQAGVTVEEDFLKAECDALNAPFFHYITKKQPYVAMKYAMTADGKIATTTGASQWVTNAESRRHVHTLRRKYMAILSGIGTVLADNPLLNCRLEDNGRNPIRIICDSHLRIPLDSQLVQTANEIPVWIATCANDSQKKEALQQKGVEILSFEGETVPLPALMDKLGEKQISSILLECGSTLNAAMLEAGLVQRVYGYIGAKIFGGMGAKSPVGGTGVTLPDDAPLLHLVETQTFGNDILCVYDIKQEEL